MIKRLSWVSGTVLLLFIMIAFAGAAEETMGTHPVTTTEKLEDLGNESDFQRKTITEKTNTYYYSISTILTSSEAVNQTIQEWLEQEKNQFIAYVMDLKPYYREQPVRLEITVDHDSITDELHSLVYTVNCSEPDGESRSKVFNLDLKEEKILRFYDVLAIDDSNIEEFRAILDEYIEDASDLSGLMEAIGENSNLLNWQINTERLILLMDHVTVEIPLERLIPYLTELMVTRLSIPPQGDSVNKLDPNVKYIALTFDDGPSPAVTPRILETLNEHNAKATFFMLGSRVQYYPELAKEVAAAGHEIGNHTVSHPNLSKLSEEQIRQEILETNRIIEEVIGIYPDYFRPPYGVYNRLVEMVALEYQSPIVLWSVDSLDWKIRNAEGVNQLVQNTISPGSIVLLHDIHSSTADALPILMAGLENEGYQFVTVSELLSLQEMNGIGPYYGVAY